MRRVLKIIAQRIALGIFTLSAISVLIFFGTQLLPGDVAETILGQQATAETVAAIRRELGLDRPAFERFIDWLARLSHGDLGTSLANGTPISGLLAERLANTLMLASCAAVIAVPLSIGLGILSVMNKGRIVDRLTSWTALTFISLPEFFLGYALIFIFCVQFGWLPNLSNVYASMGLAERLHAIILPCATLVLIVSAHMIRMTRVAILNVLSSPFIEMARLKGLSTFRVVGIHALANAIAPIVTVVVLNLAYLIVGVVVVEVVFVYPGIGQMMVDSVSKRDIPVVQACALIFGATYILMNTVADVVALLSNPRIRHPK
jgi:peptide/nickel transport system permease protein